MSNFTNATQKFLKNIDMGKEDYNFLKKIGKALLCTYTVFGVAWLWKESSSLGWWTSLKPQPKEEKEMAHLNERSMFPYPAENGPDNLKKKLESKNFEQEEAKKLWLRLRNEVISELQEKGYNVE